MLERDRPAVELLGGHGRHAGHLVHRVVGGEFDLRGAVDLVELAVEPLCVFAGCVEFRAGGSRWTHVRRLSVCLGAGRARSVVRLGGGGGDAQLTGAYGGGVEGEAAPGEGDEEVGEDDTDEDEASG